MNDTNTTKISSLEALVGEVADDFTQRLNRGDQPQVEDYVRRYPELADLLREVLPAISLFRIWSDDPAQGESSSPPRLGDYDLLREVGRGGMGIVYEAKQVSLDRRVALKVLPFAATLDAKQRQRFQNEAQAAASLHHDNIVPVYSVGSDRGVCFYAMQFVEGQSLAELIAQLRQPHEIGNDHSTSTSPPAARLIANRATQNPAFFRDVARIFLQAAEALAHSHQQGVIHRDVKPGNLLLDSSGRLWVTDFGLARFRAEPRLTLTGDLVGTLRYMSPEQALAKPGLIDHRSDIYSLGATMYELLTLHPPYDGSDREQLMRQMATEEPKPMRRLDPSVPRELEKVVLKSMEREPERRYLSADELADDLRRYLEDRPVLARRPTLTVRAGKFARRHRASAIAAGSMLVAAVIGLMVTVVIVWHEKEMAKKALARQEAESRRAEENFRKVLDGTKGLMLRLEDRRWDQMSGISDLRKDVVDEGLSFFQKIIDDKNSEPSVRFEAAQTYQMMANVYCVRQDAPHALEALGKSISLLHELISADPTQLSYHAEMANAHSLTGALYVSLHQPEQARSEYLEVVAEYRGLLDRDSSGEIANSCAWLLADCAIESVRDPSTAAILAQQAVERAPKESRFWNTLGVARYRSGDWPGAIAALRRSAELNGGGTPWDWFFLAMAWHRLGDDGQSRIWKDKALQSLDQKPPQELLRYQKELIDLMGDAALIEARK